MPVRRRNDWPALLALAGVLVGWALLVFVIWLAVPLVSSVAVEPFLAMPADASAGERVRGALGVALILWGVVAAAALAWFGLIDAGGLRERSAAFATLVAALYAASGAGLDFLAPLEGADPTGLRPAAEGTVGTALTLFFAFAVGAVLLRVEAVLGGVPAAPPDQFELNTST